MTLLRIGLVLAFSGSLHAQTVALVTDLAGNAGSLAILSEVQQDSRVRLEGTLSVLYYASGQEYRFKGPAQIAFGTAGPKVIEGAPAQAVAVAPGKKIEVKPGGVTPATFAMRGGPSAELRAQAEALRPAAGAPFSERVAYAAWLEQQQLGDEARAWWKKLAAERPDSAQLRALAN
jgi:hypothetical protein